jgi:heptosyltransferase-2
MGRVLLVKLGAIGDAVMMLPVAHALHAQGNDVEWLCGEQIAPLLTLYPWIRPIIVDEAELLWAGRSARLRLLLRLWRQMAGRHYDLIATVYYDSRYRLLTRSARAGRRVWLSMEDRDRRILPGRHHTDEYGRILLSLKDEVRPVAMSPVSPPRMPVSPVPRTGSAPRVVLVPAGAKNLVREDALRRWPIAHYVDVARELLEQGCEVILSGGSGDGWASAAFAGLPVRDCIGRHTLVETVALFDSSDLVITPDTGPLHLAGITRASVVAIFGPTSPHCFLPQRSGVVALWGGEGFACRPCYDGKNYAPCPDNACMQQVTPAMVLHTAKGMLAARRDGLSPAARIEVPPSTIASIWQGIGVLPRESANV